MVWPFSRAKSKSMVVKPSFKKRGRDAIPERGRDWKATSGTDATLNHWGRANGQSINTVLSLNLTQIINRAVYESRANPIVDGTINSHANDVIGPNGPAIQFQTNDDRWNEKAESICNEVFHSVDGSGELSLSDFLKMGVRSLWTTGGMLAQYVNDPDATTIIKQRLHVIPIQQMYSGRKNTNDTMLGITRNTFGRPTEYHILKSGIEQTAYSVNLNPIKIPARDIQHVYQKYESQQWRGYPFLSSALQALAELDEYDTAVLDAAKIGAMMAVLFYNTRDDVDSESDPKNFELLRQSGVKVPTGWQPYALNSNQPTATHGEFKADKIRDIGRPVGMPLMAIQRDASKHNYSSARFDGQGYARANESLQGFLAGKCIDPFVRLVLTESILRGILPYRDLQQTQSVKKAKKSETVDWSWIWTEPPQVDPVKEAMSQRIQMENRTLSPQRACLANNVDFDTVCKEWKKANEILLKNGLPEMLGPIPTDPNMLAMLISQQEQKDDNDTTKN